MAKRKAISDKPAKMTRAAKSRKRYFENSGTGRFWQVQLMPRTLTSWEGDVGEDVAASVTVLANVFVAEEAYDKLVAQYLRTGYREMPKSKQAKKARPKKKPIPKQWDDAVFGLLHRVKGTNELWKRNTTLKFLGQTWEVTISVCADYEEGLSKQQKQAYLKLMEMPALLRQAERELLDYYKSICRDLRDQFGDSKDDLAPIVRSMKQFSKIVTPTELYFPYSHGRSRTAGLLLNCRWDESHGLAVKFVNEKLKEIGNQDIIL